MNKKLFGFVTFLIVCFAQVEAKNYYVSKSGSDSNNGSESAPFLSISKASGLLQAGDTCFVKAGVYRETVQFTNNGISSKPIVITHFENDSVVVSATDVLSNWEAHKGVIYRAKVNMPLGIKNMLYANHKPMDWARWPNNTDNNVYTIQCDSVESGTASSIKSAKGIPNLNWTGGYIWYLGAHSGMSWTRPITSQSGDVVNYEAVDISKWPFNPHNPTVFRNNNRGRYYLFGVYDAIDYEREWFYNSSKDSVYFQAPGNVNPSTLTVEVAKREYTLKLNKNYTVFDGINAFGGKIEMDGDNTVLRNGHYLNCLQRLDDLKNTSAQVGTGAIHIKGANVIIENNTINGSSLNGIYVQGWGGVDKATIRHNYILNCNSVGNHSSPIRANASNHKILSNTIKTTGRDGIYCSGYNNEIAYNDISYCMMINNDGGVFYTVGNDNQKNMKIHHNWMHNSFGPWYADGRAAGIYLDNNSKGFDVHHNVVWNISWTGLQINWNNNNIDFFNNSLVNCSEATGRWANGYVENDNRVWNNYSTVGTWSTVDFKPSLKTNVIDKVSLQDKSNPDFRPLANSALVDKGTVISGITDNAVGSAPDIGAYERGIKPWIPGVNTVYGGEAETDSNAFLRNTGAYELIENSFIVLDTTKFSSHKTIHLYDSLTTVLRKVDTLVNNFTKNDITFIDSTFTDTTIISTLHLDSIFNVQYDSLLIATKDSTCITIVEDSFFVSKTVQDTLNFSFELDFDTITKLMEDWVLEDVDSTINVETYSFSFQKLDTLVISLIEKNEAAWDISVYPNPAINNDVKVEIPLKSGKAKLQILSANGSLIHQMQIIGNTTTVPSSIFKSSGVYFIKVEYQNQIVRKKLMVQ